MGQIKKKNYRQTNINMPLETYEALKTMMFSEGLFSRSAFISGLIDQEYERRKKAEKAAPVTVESKYIREGLE